MAKFSKRSLTSLVGVHPDLVRLMLASIEDTPIDFTITEGVRTAEKQRQYYNQGRTTKGIIVTNLDGIKKKSNHQIKADGYGHAIDLYPFHSGSVQVNDNKSLKVISDHIKKKAKELNIAITWGGDWTKPYDPPHFELKNK